MSSPSNTTHSVSQHIEIIKWSKNPIDVGLSMTFLYNRYFPKLLAHAERKLSGMYGTDPLTPPGSALRHVLTELPAGNRPNLNDRKQLLVELYRRLRSREQDQIRKVWKPEEKWQINNSKRIPANRQRSLDNQAYMLAAQEGLEKLCFEFGQELTPQEQEVFDHRYEGLSISEIAARMDLSPRSINTIVQAIKDKMDAFLDASPRK